MSRKCPVPNCGASVGERKYLCPPHWEMLDRETRRRLYLRDSKALERLLVLRDQLENNVPLDCIVVPA